MPEAESPQIRFPRKRRPDLAGGSSYPVSISGLPKWGESQLNLGLELFLDDAFLQVVLRVEEQV